jgi:hypothetical protein
MVPFAALRTPFGLQPRAEQLCAASGPQIAASGTRFI